MIDNYKKTDYYRRTTHNFLTLQKLGQLNTYTQTSRSQFTQMARSSQKLLVLTSQKQQHGCYVHHIGPVWFSFFLTSFSENLAVGRIWLCRESEYH
jgi:hypothetical protein